MVAALKTQQLSQKVVEPVGGLRTLHSPAVLLKVLRAFFVKAELLWASQAAYSLKRTAVQV